MLFSAGLGILLHQAFIARPVQPELVTAAVALLLAPAVTRVDDSARDRSRDDETKAEGVDHGLGD